MSMLQVFLQFFDQPNTSSRARPVPFKKDPKSQAYSKCRGLALTIHEHSASSFAITGAVFFVVKLAGRRFARFTVNGG
jgi:hypothetical protein